MPRIENSLLRTALDNNDPFIYTHLVKFERPRQIDIENENVKFDTDASKFAYISDGAYNISYNDGTEDLQGNANGAQVYVANKLKDLGSLSESSDLKISSFNLTLDATAAGVSLTAVWTITNVSGNTCTLTLTPGTGRDGFMEAGFQEDDTIIFSTGSNTGKNFRIKKIQTSTVSGEQYPGYIATLEIAEKGGTPTAETSVSGTISIDSSEINTLLSETQATNFVNRKVTVYKAFLYPDNPSTIIGEPLCIFSGIITSADYTQEPSKSSVLRWGLKSNWGDFQQVRGRLGSAEFHQALDEKGRPNPKATLRPEYARDYGFMHADRAVDVTAVYQAMETRTRTWRKKKWFKKKFHMEEYEVEVDREADFNINLQSKYIPLIYGVRRTMGNPVFADTAKNGPDKIFVAEAICEGPIHGILNMGLDEKSAICLDDVDEGTRGTSASDENTDVVCYGRADAGTVLGGTGNTAVGTVSYNSNNNRSNSNTIYNSGTTGIGIGSHEFDAVDMQHLMNQMDDQTRSDLLAATTPGDPTTNDAGIIHEENFQWNDPAFIQGEFHAGTSHQKVSKMLYEQANDTGKGFQLQHSLYGSNLSGDYWGSSHQLLDTAYVAVKQTITDEDVEMIPIDYTVKGKLVECKNYDASYEHHADPTYSSENIANFGLGDTVNIKATKAFSSGGTNYSAGQVLASNVLIKDLFFFYAGSRVKNWRVRWDLTAAQSTLLKAAKEFYMENSGSATWHMITFDATISTTVGNHLLAEITAESGTKNRVVTVKAGDWPSDLASFSAMGYRGTIVQIDYPTTGLLRNLGSDFKLTIAASGSTYTSTFPSYVNNISGTSGTGMVLTNMVYLHSSSSDFSSSDTTMYDGKRLAITKTLDSGDQIVIERIVEDYKVVGGVKVFTVTSPFHVSELPKTGDTVTVDLGEKDVRATSNPAMILYDYMTNKRYGGAIDADTIDTDSFLLSAQTCDTPSDVTIVMTGSVSSVNVGDVYKYNTSGITNANTFWQGKVKSLNTADNEVTFTECVGKFTHKHNNWAYRNIGEVVWDPKATTEDPSNCRRITTAGAQTDDYTSNSTPVTTMPLVKVSGSGPTALNAKTDVANPASYSLYDADDVKYWKYLNWDSHDQRWVTRHQCNIEIDTSGPVFKTAQAIVDHFNGIISFAGGKYKLSVKTQRDTGVNIPVDRPSHYIQEEDIIGKISVKDKGLSKAFNSLTANIKDPQNHFKQRSVNFFDSEYLKQDRGVVRSTNFGVDGITNYYNARMMVKQLLDSSRYNRTITFQMRPTGLNIIPGEIIQVVNDSIGWVGKYFRVDNISINKDCLVNITASEHHDNVYLIPAIRKSAFYADPSSERLAKIPSTPTGLAVASATVSSPNIVTWNPSTGISNTNGYYEIWRKNSLSGNSSTAVTAHAELAGVVAAEKDHSTSNKPKFVDIGFTNTAAATYYYWVRAYNTLTLQTTSGSAASKNYYSAFNANSNYDGLTAVATSSKVVQDGESPISVNVKRNAVSVECNSAGTPILSSGSIPNSGNEFYVYEGLTALQFDGVGVNNGTWKVTINASNVTPGAITDVGAHAVVANATALGATIGELTFNFSGKTAGGDTFTFTRTQEFFKQIPGETGTAVELTPSKYVINYTKSGSESDTISFTATPRNMESITPHYQFVVGGTEKQAYGTTATFTLADSDEPATGNSVLVSVNVKDGGSGDVLAGDSVSIYGVQDGKDAVTGFLTNPTAAIPAENDGSLASGALDNADGTFKVFIGGQDRTTHSAVTFAASNASGMSASINSTTGAYSTSALSADKANIDFTATIAANAALGVESAITVGPLTFSLAKSKEGAQGNSITGATGPRTATGRLYYNTTASSAPSAPTASGFVYSTAAFNSLTTNWVYAPPTYASGNTNKYWYTTYTVTEASYGGSQTVTIGTVTQAIGFSGLVTFTSANVLSDGTNTKTPIEAGQVNANVTSIDGGVIDTGVINLGTSSGMAVRQAKTSYSSTAAGFWIGNDSGTPRFNLGEANKYLKWDGSTLNIKGGIQGDLAGGLTVGSSGWIAGGQTQYNNGTGFFIGYQSGYKFSLGNPSGNHITWNGSTLAINGSVTFSNSPNISSLNNDSGYTDNTVANAASTAASNAQTTANTANSAAGAAQTTANSASSAASAASTAASNASSLAASKVRVFRQTSTPTALAIGDLWYDTDANNKLYIATATGTGSWSASDLTSINGGVIATGTLAAASIVTDSITANQMAANSIDASELKISSTSSSASSMFFDGTNNRIDIKDASGVLRVRIGNL